MNADTDAAAAVSVALERLIAPNQTGMGAMFKVLVLLIPAFLSCRASAAVLRRGRV